MELEPAAALPLPLDRNIHSTAPRISKHSRVAEHAREVPDRPVPQLAVPPMLPWRPVRPLAAGTGSVTVFETELWLAEVLLR